VSCVSDWKVVVEEGVGKDGWGVPKWVEAWRRTGSRFSGVYPAKLQLGEPAREARIRTLLGREPPNSSL